MNDRGRPFFPTAQAYAELPFPRAHETHRSRINWTVRQPPPNAVRGHRNVANLDTPRATFSVDAAEPQVLLASSIDLPFKAGREVLNGTTHELRVSVRCIERCIWVARATYRPRCT